MQGFTGLGGTGVREQGIGKGFKYQLKVPDILPPRPAVPWFSPGCMGFRGLGWGPEFIEYIS